MKKTIVCWLMVLSLLTGFVLVFAQESAAAPIELKAIAAHPVGDATTDLFLIFIDRVNKAAKGKLVINFKGGPEAIPGCQQAEAIRKGVVDMGSSTSGLCSSLVPAGLAIFPSGLSGKEQRKSGFYDAVNKYFMKANLFYLVFNGDTNRFAVYSATKVTKPADLKGRMMRSTATYDALFKALGCKPVSMPHGEVYSAMERGVVDGFAFPISAVASAGLHEVIKTFIDHPIWNGGQFSIMNLKTWQSLPKNLQDLLTKVSIDFEAYEVEFWKQRIDKARAAMKAKKVKFVKFSPKDAKWYINTANKAAWAKVEKSAPEAAPQLKKLAGL